MSADYDIEGGRVAYGAYCEHKDRNGQFHLFSGSYPPFDELPLAMREAWIAAANAVKERFGAIY